MYPERINFVGLLATIFTPVKWALIALAFLALLPGLSWNLIDKYGRLER
jgi:hypothetical protein